ncbi:hypothetical protein ACOTTU_22510 [Roseobacter sp. EG26]|uniref:hypothetical protein n=1 Tax=Roseobacter sp. EG26 TaxID=3412477 RepID=UPI003CE5606F
MISRIRVLLRPFLAVSGVSGGSVGATTFWAIRKSGDCREATPGTACFAKTTHEILGRDYLSAVLDDLLFQDNFDGFFPLSAIWSKPTDRGATLQDRLSDAITLSTYLTSRISQSGAGAFDLENVNFSENLDLIRIFNSRSTERNQLLSLGLRESWDGEATTPLLFFNTTDLTTRERVIHSPLTAFLPRNSARNGLPDTRVSIASSGGHNRDLSVGDATVISARFPIVSPPARYHLCTEPACHHTSLRQVADGGYFDNTGLETISDILTAMESDPEIAGRNIVVEVLAYDVRTDPEPEALQGTLSAPLKGVVRATNQRRNLTVSRFCERWVHRNPGLQVEPRVVALDLTKKDLSASQEKIGGLARINFTVSWRLAQSTFIAIDALTYPYGGEDQPLCGPNAR